MLEPAQTTPSASLQYRVVALEQELWCKGRLDGFAALYGPMVPIALLLTLTPFYADAESHGVTRHYYNLWEMATKNSLGVVGLILIFSVVGLLLVATFRPGIAGVPTGIAILSAIMTLMLLTKVGIRTEAKYSLAGQAAILFSCYGIVVGSIHEYWRHRTLKKVATTLRRVQHSD